MNLVLYDDPITRLELFPFSLTRPVSEVRVGILTIAEKWEARLKTTASYLTAPYLQHKYSLHEGANNNLLINGSVCPDDRIVKAVQNLHPGEALIKGNVLLAVLSDHATLPASPQFKPVEFASEVTIIDRVWKIFQLNAEQLKLDFAWITAGRQSEEISDPHTIVYHPEKVFIEKGVTVKAATLNAENGPIYLGKNSQVHEGAVIRGSFALGEGSIVSMGARVRGDTSIGPFSKIGGEVSNSVVFGYSNKAHDGFLGNSVLGEWCNLGADTNTSNMKNNYDTVKIWSHVTKGFRDTGLQFCGLLMGDHSKCGINTMFNTGTVVGVGANVFGDGFPRTLIPSFAWGGAAGFTTFQLNKALETANRAMERRSTALSDVDREILTHVFHMTAENRVWEKK